MAAYLEKTEENADFHQILDFLTSISINFALTVSPTIYALYIEQFWNTACLKTINSEKQIHANVDGKAVVVSESSVRRDLHLNDEDGIACLTTNEIFENLALMGYEPASDKLTFYKGLFSLQWKYLIHTILHCLSSKSTSWDQFFTNLAFAIICLAKGQKFNFSKLIFDGISRNLDPKKVGDEAINEEMFDSVERVATTASSLEAKRLWVVVPWAPKKPMGGIQAQNRSEGCIYLLVIHSIGGHTLGSELTHLEVVRTAKEKGFVIKNIEDSSRPVRTITTLQPLPTVDPKDKDVEVSLRLQAEFGEELLSMKEKDKKRLPKVCFRSVMFDEVQARMDADYELAARMTQEEQERYTIDERAMLLAEFFERRKKHLAAERAEAIRNKPPTKTQLRNLTMTYIKNIGGYKHSQLKGKSYEEIQGLYERHQKRIQNFTPMDSEKEAQKPGKRLKRVAGSYATQKSPKKPKVMKSVKDVTEEEEAADYVQDQISYVNWEYQLLEKMEAKDMLVQERFQDHPLEGHDLLLWGDLRMIFDPDEKDELWMNQLDWKLLRWKLYESCGVHTLFMDGTPMEINMLVEKKYPLIKELLEKMLNLQLEAEEESTMAFELIKFIKSLLEE
ncbi:hypothetical protein Tco_1013159 [Tanacetum coccineum]